MYRYFRDIRPTFCVNFGVESVKIADDILSGTGTKVILRVVQDQTAVTYITEIKIHDILRWRTIVTTKFPKEIMLLVCAKATKTHTNQKLFGHLCLCIIRHILSWNRFYFLFIQSSTRLSIFVTVQANFNIEEMMLIL